MLRAQNPLFIAAIILFSLLLRKIILQCRNCWTIIHDGSAIICNRLKNINKYVFL